MPLLAADGVIDAWEFHVTVTFAPLFDGTLIWGALRSPTDAPVTPTPWETKYARVLPAAARDATTSARPSRRRQRSRRRRRASDFAAGLRGLSFFFVTSVRSRC